MNESKSNQIDIKTTAKYIVHPKRAFEPVLLFVLCLFVCLFLDLNKTEFPKQENSKELILQRLQVFLQFSRAHGL